MKRLNPKKEQQAVDDWNRVNPVGTLVTVVRDDESTLDTETLTEAKMLGGHSAVIWVKGIAGAYRLDRVTPRHTEPNRNLGLDVTVAERVMGWKHYQSTKGLKLTFFLSPESYANNYIQSQNLVEVTSGNEENAPRFSSNFELAFQVRDVMAKQLFSVRYKFVNVLLRIISDRIGGAPNSDLLHESEIILKMTAEDICQAAVEAMKES